MEKDKTVYVIGHKNPDTDSICSAIAYADIKTRISGGRFIPKRAGQLNEETQFVLERFGMEAPALMTDVGTQVKDIEIRKTEGVNSGISLKRAWEIMKEKNVVTLAITNEREELEGLITIGDIATSYMDVYDSRILATARTKYRNIIETINGTMVIGNEHSYFMHGKVLVAAANPDLMESYIEEDDLVILGNRYESQLCAIEMNAGCIIVCEGAPVSRTICKLAEERGCTIISSPHDTFTVARLIYQSMPIKYFMRSDHLITFQTESFVDDIHEIMAKKRHRDFPILDEEGRYVGMISRRNLLNAGRKNVILVDHNEKSQAVDGIESAEILEIIDHHRIGTLETVSPVYFRNQPLGCTATILCKIYDEHNLEIPPKMAGLLCAAILSDTLMYRSPTCTRADREAAEKLAGIAGINVEEFSNEMFRAGSNLKNKTPEEIFLQDFKKFSANDVSFGVGQINVMRQEDLEEIKGTILDYLPEAYQKQNVQMLFFMLTNIVRERTELLCIGANASKLIEETFEVTAHNQMYLLRGVVSRKKQLLPALVEALQQ
ncbi:MAG: putative manganese-dependent inorganic diphosphatase [Lachnospiraceae bacterium]|nr:putative manganese-dependent inorganic diphosphatase [Lachnospiraceae bacterium]